MDWDYRGFDVDAPRLPAEIAPLVAGCSWRMLVVGMSGQDVMEASRDGAPFAFLKRGTDRLMSACEAVRLRWLGRTGVPCPDLMACWEVRGRYSVLTSAVQGRDLCAGEARDAVPALHEAVARLHSLDPAKCPFDARLEVGFEEVEARLDAGLVKDSDVADEFPGLAAREAFAALLAEVPALEELAVTHGDLSMPNVVAHEGRLSGVVDLGQVGVADRHRDLAIACRSLRHHLGADSVEAFLDLYGRDRVDPIRLAFYRRLDCFL